MKHFTRELIEMGRSTDHAVLNRQEELWDSACDRYFGDLDALKTEMPSGLRQLVDGYYLHDAAVLGMGQQGGNFLIVLQLDTPPRCLLILNYSLEKDPLIDRAGLPPEPCARGRSVDWQHDEIERGPGEPATWGQSILLSNGWEVRLHFRDVQLREVQSLLPVTVGFTTGTHAHP